MTSEEKETLCAELREHVRYQYMPAACRQAMDQAAATLERLQAQLIAATEASEQFERAFFAEQSQVEALKKTLEQIRHEGTSSTHISRSAQVAGQALAALSTPAEARSEQAEGRP